MYSSHRSCRRRVPGLTLSVHPQSRLFLQHQVLKSWTLDIQVDKIIIIYYFCTCRSAAGRSHWLACRTKTSKWHRVRQRWRVWWLWEQSRWYPEHKFRLAPLAVLTKILIAPSPPNKKHLLTPLNYNTVGHCSCLLLDPFTAQKHHNMVGLSVLSASLRSWWV